MEGGEASQEGSPNAMWTDLETQRAGNRSCKAWGGRRKPNATRELLGGDEGQESIGLGVR